jgi:hypothetical protein
MADRDPRETATANLTHVSAVAGQILLEKFFFGANTFQDHKAKCNGGNECKPGPNGQRAGRNGNEHGEITGMPHEAIGPAGDELVSTFRLQTNLG